MNSFAIVWILGGGKAIIETLIKIKIKADEIAGNNNGRSIAKTF